MEANIEKIVSDFASKIQYNISCITNSISIIRDKIKMLREIYVDLIEKNNHKQIFLFCLESFNFQNKTLLYEVDHLHKTFNMLLNRTYRDYYKLYNIILKLFSEYKLENNTKKVHIEYRDLDTNMEFSLDNISSIHDDVIYLTCVLIDKYKECEALIRQYKTKSKTGIYIINLINTIEYDNAILKDQIDLYINYLFFFQDTQNTYFSKLYNKLEGFQAEIDNDIHLQIDEEPEQIIVNENIEIEIIETPVIDASANVLDKVEPIVAESVVTESVIADKPIIVDKTVVVKPIVADKPIVAESIIVDKTVVAEELIVAEEPVVVEEPIGVESVDELTSVESTTQNTNAIVKKRGRQAK